MDPLTAGVMAAGTIANSGLGSIGAKKRAQRQQKYNLELADRQYGHQVDMWNKMNSYNAPSAQMQRFKDAGLNPHLIYGKGSASAGNASTMPQYQEQAANMQHGKDIQIPINVIGMYQEYERKKNDLIIQQDTLKLLAETQEERIKGSRAKQYGTIQDTLTKNYQRQFKQQELRVMQATADVQIESAKTNLLQQNKNITRTDLANWQAQVNLAHMRQTKGKMLTQDQVRINEGMSDILSGNLNTPQAQSVMYDIAKYGSKELIDLTKNLIPIKGIGEVLNGALRRFNIKKNRGQ